MKRTLRILTIAVVAALGLMLVAGPATAQTEQKATVGGVINVVAQVDDTLNDLRVLNNVGEINVVDVNESFNENDVRVLNNVLNNSPILSNNVVTIQDFLNNCTVLSCIEIRNVLNNNNIAISDVIAVDVLSGGDITIFVN